MHGTIHDAVIADVRARQVQGEREYGQKHLLFNGLDGLTEAYEEALDQAFWLRQEIEERRLRQCPDLPGFPLTLTACLRAPILIGDGWKKHGGWRGGEVRDARL